MSQVTITTNNHPREILYGYQLSAKEAEGMDLDMSKEDDMTKEFFRYRGELYILSDFTPIPRGMEDLYAWDAYASDSYFSGVVIRYPRDEYGDADYESVICGTYIS